MAAPPVRHTTLADEPAVIDTMTMAFSNDPVTRWFWPDPHQYLDAMPAFTRAFAGGAFAHGSAYCSDRYAGAAMWLPPGVQPDGDQVGVVLERTVSRAIRDDLFGVFEQMAKGHPHAPHWYLPIIGVDPAHQGKGYGSALLTKALESCDRDHLPAYLEATNPRNMVLYKKHGFEEVGTIQCGASPPLIPMLRKAR